MAKFLLNLITILYFFLGLCTIIFSFTNLPHSLNWLLGSFWVMFYFYLLKDRTPASLNLIYRMSFAFSGLGIIFLCLYLVLKTKNLSEPGDYQMLLFSTGILFWTISTMVFVSIPSINKQFK